MLEYLDKPKLPEDIVQEINETVEKYKKATENQKGGNVVNNKLPQPSHPNGSIGYPLREAPLGGKWCSNFSYIPASGRIEKWVHDNLTDQPSRTIMIYMSGGSALWPHIDDFRRSAWNYVITDSSATLCYYEPKKEYAHLKTSLGMYVPIERLNKVEEYEIEKNRWYNFESTRIHGVENLEKERTILSVSFGVPRDLLMKKDVKPGTLLI